jgi:hypothetical protein
MELEPATTPFENVEDRRPRLLPPPPVQLVAITDISLLSSAGLEKDLDRFYVGLLGFERQETAPDANDLMTAYRAANFRLNLYVVEKMPPRPDYRPAGVIVPSLEDLMRRFTDAQIAFLRQRGLMPGTESLLVNDPAGNLLEITESRMLG